MKVLAQVLVLTGLASALKNVTDKQGRATCNRWGYWGQHCDTVCSPGCKVVEDSYQQLLKRHALLSEEDYSQIVGTRACWPESGVCIQDAPNCDISWRNMDEYHRCDVPMANDRYFRR